MTIEPAGDLFHVAFAYGRRGATLQTGRKTSSPLSLAEAEKIASKLVAEKTAKGYTKEEGGTPYQSSANEGRDTGVRCQLLNPVDAAGVQSLLQDRRHLLQEKHDGKRLLVLKRGQEVTGINRRGLAIGVPEPIINAALELPVDFLVDGEAVGDKLHAFDLLEVSGKDLRSRSYFDRLAGLLCLLDATSHIRPVSTTVEPKEKLAMFQRLRAAGAEGVVFKDTDAVFSPGRPASGGAQLKFKFVTTGSFIVAAVNRRRSVALELIDGTSCVPAGNVTIPPDHEIPAVGDMVEIRYLYAFRQSGSVYQPVYRGRRDDVEIGDCHVGQLKFKDESVAA